MPNIKSAKKRVKVIAVKTMRNKIEKTVLKTAVKKTETAIASGAEDKAEALAAAVKTIDKSVSKGILHKNTAARKKSNLVKSFAKAQNQGA